MASSPGYTTPDTGKKKFEADYSGELRDFAYREVLDLMPYGDALLLESSAENPELDILKILISEGALACRMNKGEYDDHFEDFIASSCTMPRLIQVVRTERTHEAAERVRLLRSALLCLMLSADSSTTDLYV